MTVIKSVKLYCDFPGCPGRFDRGHINLTNARREAKQQGWKIIRGLIDLCGPRDKAPDWENDPLKDHAGGPHIPILKPRGKTGTYFDVSCECGWVDPEKLPAARFNVRHRWGTHLTEGSSQ